MLKKLFILLALMVSLSLSAFAAEKTDKTAVELLYNLEIMNGYDDGELHPEYNVTRMECAALLIRCLGFEEIGNAVNADTGFTDVPTDSWGAGYVSMAKDFGIIEGYDNTTFGPEDNVKIVDVAKILISATGYSIYAENKGGYPQGYIAEASEQGILDGIESYDGLATREDVARMIFNTLDLEFMKKEMNSNATLSYVKDNRTMLEAMNITKMYDQVKAVYGADIGMNRQLEKNQIAIGNTVYAANPGIDYSVLGMNAYVYVKDYDGNARVLLVNPDSKNKKVVVNGEDIESTTTITNLVYTENNKEKDFDIAVDADIVYNGKLLATTAERVVARLVPDCGNVTLLDKNDDDIYDIVFVKDYDTYVVKSVRANGIFDIYGNNLNFDEEETQVNVKLRGGQSADYSDILPGAVLSVAASLDKSNIEIIISDKAVSGNVKLKQVKDGKTYYTFDGDNISYRMSDTYLAAITSKLSKALDFKIGEQVIWYLDAFDGIAYAEYGKLEDTEIGEKVEPSKTGLNYGYLIKLFYDSGEEVCVARLITEGNKYEAIYVGSDSKVVYGRNSRGSYVTTKVNTSVLATELGVGDNTVQQLVAYKTNDEGIIKELYLRDRTGTPDNFSLELSNDYRMFAYGTIDNKYVYDNNTVVFHIPSKGKYIDRISVGKPSDYFANNKSYTVSLYDIQNESNYVNLIVYEEAVSDYTQLFVNFTNSPVMLVTNTSYALDEDGESTLVVEGIQDGNIVKVPVSKRLDWNVVSGEIVPGVVIQYITDSKYTKYAMTSDEPVGLAKYNVLMNCNDREINDFVMWNYEGLYTANAKIKICYGTVERIDYPILKFSGLDDDNLISLNSGTRVYKYNGSFETAEYLDIQPGDKIFVRARYNYPREIIIVEE